MRLGGRAAALLGLLALLFLAGSVIGASVRPDGSPITITPVAPTPGGTISSQTPTIKATLADSGGTIDPSSLVMFVDHTNVTGFQTLTVTTTSVSYAVPSILKLPNGNHQVSITVGDDRGHQETASWGFMVNTSASSFATGGLGIDLVQLVTDVLTGAAVFGAAFAGYILYLKRTKRFTFRKYFATHPVNKQYLTLLIPGVAAFVFVLVALTYVLRTRGLPLLAPEYVLVIGLFIGLTVYAIDARREKIRIRAYERAFAQFLFEMADAMRGGLDPAKALVELSKTHTNILRKPLRIAADGIKVGRPFDLVLRTMVLPMKSPLVTRYAELIADASSVGGETSAVVHRAAKDMDDFIKIEQERSAALTMPVAVLYIAFGVLMAVLFSLLSIEPSLGSISISFFGSGGNPLSNAGHAAAASGVPRLSASTLTQRFADLMIINALGTGIIIGAFTEGKAKYGLLHSLGLLGATAIAFAFFAP